MNEPCECQLLSCINIILINLIFWDVAISMESRLDIIMTEKDFEFR